MSRRVARSRCQGKLSVADAGAGCGRRVQYGGVGGSQSEPGSASFVNLQGLAEAIANLLSEVRGFENFDFGAVAEQVHEEFAVSGVGQLEAVAAVVEEGTGLLGVPDFARNPASDARREAQDGAAALWAGEDAVAGTQLAVELVFGDVKGGSVGNGCLLDGVEGKAAEGIALVAPGVEVPVIAVVDEALRGNLAAGALATGPGEVEEMEAAAGEQSGADGLEVLGGDRSGGDGQDADATHEFECGSIGGAEEFFEQAAQG